jgi:hypothetical protein
MIRHIKLMADYGCYPLWDASPETGPGNIDPLQVPLSEGLRRDLMSWAAAYDKTLNSEDPLNSGFKDPEEEKRFAVTASALGSRLQKELGPAVRVEVKV